MVFHYSGSWGSDGDYSLTHNLEDANTVLDYLLADNAHGIDKERIYAIGHSLGGFVCGQLTAHRPQIRGGVLLMPCDIGQLPVIETSNPAAGETIRAVLEDSAKWLNGTSGAALYQEAKANAQAFRLENAAAALAQKPLLCIAGTLDVYTPLEQHCMPLARAMEQEGSNSFHLISYPTDHFFADYRISVAEAVIAFLRRS